jgi:selenide,water dikinase
MKSHLKDIIFLGGGHSNTLGLRELALRGFINNNKGSIRIKLISDTPYSAYSGTVPGLICGYYTKKECMINLPKFCKQIDIDFIQAKAISLKPQENKLILEHGEEINYDILSINVGSKTLGSTSIEGVQEYTITTRPIGTLLTKIEQKEKTFFQSISNINHALRIGIVGGGVAGIELAFSMKSRMRKLYNKEANVVLINKNERIIGKNSPNVCESLMRILKDNQIEVENSSEVIKITDNNILYNVNKRKEFDMMIWAAGAEAHELNHNLNLQLDKNGWILVKNTLQSVDFPNVFGSGDCIQLNLYQDFPPKSGVYAVREASILSKNIENYLNGDPLLEYLPQKDFLALITLGNHMGFGTKFGLCFKGKWVWNMKKHIDLNFIKQFDEEINNTEKRGAKKDEFNLKADECIKYLFYSENEESFEIQLNIIDQLAKDENLLDDIKKRLNL